jgi:hypothetical protein|tara:strand:+ start:397 stop:585 length:189 start_codon:yes stop_codon:yes gene_type:complete
MAKKKETNDLDIKIGSKDQIFWEKVKKDTETNIEEHEKTLKFLNATLEMAEMKITAEKIKFK